MTDIQKYLVGGAVRDALIGKPTKDYDYTVVVPDAPTVEWAWTGMRDHLIEEGYEIFLETPEYFTIRARFPKNHPNRKITADFVLARKEGPYTDGRRPDWVAVGDLYDDLARRDFTVNALAQDETGRIIDVVGGKADLANRRLRAVGDPLERLKEDALRAFRAIRFAITKGFNIDRELMYAMKTLSVMDALEQNISAERIKDELHRCFAYDTVESLLFIYNNFPMYLGIIERKGIWLEPTMKAKK
jgi:tRNA nucleotidyltransferase/poly(A) polymerase